MADRSRTARPYDGDRDRAEADAEAADRRAARHGASGAADREDGHTNPGAWRNQPTCKGRTVGELEDQALQEQAAAKAGGPQVKSFMELLAETRRERQREEGAA